MRRRRWFVGPYGVRPAGPPGRCFYCRAVVGLEHDPDCVIRRRTVVVRLTVDYVTTVQDIDGPPPDDALFHWNEGTYCLDNAIEEIHGLLDDDDGFCICDSAALEYVREATPEDEELWGVRVAAVPS